MLINRNTHFLSGDAYMETLALLTETLPNNKIMNTSSTSSHFPFSDLPYDIITHILATLPVKTLAKFRAVCTSWRTYIDSPSFISKHRNLYNKEHSKNSHLLIEETYSPRRFCLQRVTNGQKLTTLVFLPSFSAHPIIPWIYGACNGLFLMRMNGIYLWNPFLRKSLILLPCPIVTPFQFTHYVIGFSTSYDDYKVLAYRLRTINNGNEYEPAMAVYSLRNHIWTIKINPVNVDAWTSLRAPFSRNKYVYCGWIVYWFPEGDTKIIHSFNFNNEEFNNVAVLEPLKECMSLVLFSIGELLAVMSSSSIWVMEKHDREYTWREWSSESWIKNVFDILEEQILEEEIPISPKVFFIEQSNTFLIIGFWGGIQFYEVTSQKLETLRNKDARFYFWGAYVDTLALITGTEGMMFTRFP
ncbi:F-box/kelch-repeat protein At3g23880-like [Amaranthus tricolor]|uniref:F-box/kelch-repeat protein At3g23880-like n=1 Tax=Amaranthus tricolor TaxID=29722 RepID=UPI00258688E4|nr:F-box/kelch-repeat protein At3g23880-like [Amaranthus tricolor]XP_057543485.1 F-box/kelch-repeat protein At3g23880-like [Amaranthus tricolor]